MITVSEFSREELVELLELAPERIVVIPEGVGERFTAPAEAQRTAVARRFGIAGDYALAVGTVSARKNLAVLDAAARALAQRGIELRACWVHADVHAQRRSPLRRIGYVADEDLPALYAGARALALPSRYEGFGLPCLEAMACGTPVVAAAAGALPETIGDAGLLVEP